MYVITYKGKPATREKLKKLLGSSGYADRSMYFFTGGSAKDTKDIFVALFGYSFTWRERPKGVECQKVRVVS